MTTLADLVFAALASKSGLTPAAAYSMDDHARYVLLNGDSGGSGSITLPVGDFGGTNTAPTVVSTHLAAPLPVNQGGTGSTTQNTNPGDTVTVSYVSAAIAALQLKPEAQWGTTATLATNTYLAGVITAVGNGALAVDSGSPAVGDRVLVKNEVTQANNGLYVVTATGSAGAVFVLTRTTDMNTGALIPGALVVVQKGTVNAGSLWGIFNPGPFTIGTTAIVWTGLDVGPDLVAGSGILVSGSTISTKTLDLIPAPVAAVAFNGQKGTGAANGTVSTDLAAFGQIPLAGSAIPVPTVGGSAGSAGTFMKSDAVPTRDYWVPSDYGYATFSYLPDLVGAQSQAMNSGTVYVSQVNLSAITTIVKAYLNVQTAGSGLTAGQSFVGLYDPSNTLIGFAHVNSASTELSTDFASTGLKTITLGATGTGLTNLAPGKYRVAVFQVGTTPALIKAAAANPAVNGLLSGPNSKFGVADTGRTTSFATTLGTVSAFNGASFWVALS